MKPIQLYKQGKYDECLKELYKINTKTKYIVWGLMLLSLILDGISIYLSHYASNNLNFILVWVLNITAIVFGIVVVVGVVVVSETVRIDGIYRAVRVYGIYEAIGIAVAIVAIIVTVVDVALGGVALGVAATMDGDLASGVIMLFVIVVLSMVVGVEISDKHLIKQICKWSLKWQKKKQ